jgi:tetratricopeptide (TPR) repeat protein
VRYSVDYLNRYLIRILVGGTIGMLTGIAVACGPWFPNQMFDQPEVRLAHMREGSLAIELKRLEPILPSVPYRAVAPSRVTAKWTALVDVGELRAALNAGPTDPARVADIVAGYQELRSGLSSFQLQTEQWKAQRDLPEYPPRVASRSPTPPVFPAVRIPRGLPDEFARYIEGAIAYHRGELALARAAWQKVLDLPADQRHYRSTWAAFMLGRSYMTENPVATIRCFDQVRQLADSGFADRLGLAADSIGWQARMELDRSNTVTAIEGYIRHYRTGDPTAIVSINWAISRLLASGPAVRCEAARNLTVQRVVTAYVVAARHHTYDETPAAVTWQAIWLHTLEEAGVVAPADADRIAWIAYQAGDLAAAEKWAALASPDSLIAQWLRAKLLLRAGKIEEATAIIARLARSFPPEDPTWLAVREDSSDEYRVFPGEDKLLGELGVLRLARGQYIEALDVLLRGRYWLDAAYVAERVLTPEELSSYVDANWPKLTNAPPSAEEYEETGGAVSSEWIPESLRCLLARRLTRMGRYAQATSYFPAHWQSRLGAYAAGLRTGDDMAQPAAVRAAGLWSAARIARYEGLELMGTEVEPDWSALGGSYALTDVYELRTNSVMQTGVAPSRNEQIRVTRQAAEVNPPTRFHYRCRAADLAWRAAKLMPDESPETAAVLTEAGLWLAGKEPDRADRFYKALVRRCGQTELGSEAERLRWFPKKEITPQKP